MRSPTPEPLKATKDAAAFMDKPVSWLHHNAGPLGIPRYRVGNQWRYRLSELAEWVEHQAVNR